MGGISPGVIIGAIAALGGAALTGVITFVSGRWLAGGNIERSEAKQLWDENDKLRDFMTAEINRLNGRISELLQRETSLLEEVSTLRETNHELTLSNWALVGEVRELTGKIEKQSEVIGTQRETIAVLSDRVNDLRGTPS